MYEVNFDAVSNREDWADQVEVRDLNNVLVDLSAAVIVFSVRERKTGTTRLLAQTSDSTITIPALGTFAWTFAVALMRGMEVSRNYECGCTVELSGVTRQLFYGTVNVIDGVVP